MAAKAPFWEIKDTLVTRGDTLDPDNLGGVERIEFYAHLKGRNGKIVSHTETYPAKASVHKALEVANPNGIYEVRDKTRNLLWSEELGKWVTPSKK
jgi:uncharacterized protein YegP (UPF0339 family)